MCKDVWRWWPVGEEGNEKVKVWRVRAQWRIQGRAPPPPPLFLNQSHQNCERAKTKCLRAGPHFTSRSGSATGAERKRQRKRVGKVKRTHRKESLAGAFLEKDKTHLSTAVVTELRKAKPTRRLSKSVDRKEELRKAKATERINANV